MVKNLKLKCLLVGLITVISGGVHANAESFSVKNEAQLTRSINKLKAYDTLIIEKDLKLKKNLYLDKSVVLDLNGNTLYISSSNSSIIVGRKFPKIKKKCFLDVLKLKNDTDKFNYDDDINVIIKNGTIIHSDGLKGKNGKKNSWIDFCGKDGTTPKETISFESGKLTLSNVTINAGNGGNGGNGSYQALVHCIFGGGIGGRGGAAGNGADAIKILRNECILSTDDTVVLNEGKAGKLGKNSKANPNYFAYKAYTLKNNSKATDGQKINNCF